ncbi:2'-5' RNA ligase family protein [Agrobacterium fabrum]|jgi:RNA 2',3'-cyclic 3'-phosphodiesterase|uniref:2'-5' RNA ligase n=1 Tax=Agrobacterium fabrum TaxID=1176649 RepID=A0A7Z7BMH2_9HYPH|nr:2'-5' RNA ligase family protein [Agrobacterium fabrum]AYM63836.1 2'-5' RNA ligase [Agrobacterium fabrum]MCR6723501.1 2'-5' RNA ligase family protein [Agrobacterium fabrum]NTE59221.1 2'-5' RNA ligase family protein [Agrobacterium fabrum]UXT58678.1 2'-5' RNA ligase family protein [Agrobacterium fabrum]WCK76336.1 2'-5' RNA ligase family protein [Agrobacterium fabrum]
MGLELTDKEGLRQLFLEGFELEKQRRINPRFSSKVLIVVKPPAALAERIFTDASSHAAGRTKREAYPAELLHITLLCVGCFDTVPRGLVNRLKEALGEIRARPVPITFDGSSLFGNRNCLVLNSRREMLELRALAKMVQRALWRANLPYIAASSFMPHLTMIYGCGKIETMPVEKPYSWLAGSFEVIFSHNGETRHESLGRFALSAKADRYEQPESQLYLPQKIIGPSKRPTRKIAAR